MAGAVNLRTTRGSALSSMWTDTGANARRWDIYHHNRCAPGAHLGVVDAARAVLVDDAEDDGDPVLQLLHRTPKPKPCHDGIWRTSFSCQVLPPMSLPLRFLEAADSGG